MAQEASPVTQEPVGDLICDRSRPHAEPRPYPIVFLHGLWAGSWIFRQWLEAAAERGWDAWAPNLRGRAGSRPLDDLGAVGMADFADDLREVLIATGPAVLVGYSMGGLVAQMVADHPNVRALVLLCSVPPRGIVGLSGPVLRRSWRYLPAMVANRPFLPTPQDNLSMTMNAMTPGEQERWLPRFIADSGKAARQMAIGAIKVDPAGVTAPVLVVSAEHDRISPPAIQPKLVRRYGAEHLAVADHAHLVAIERGWERTASATLDWAEHITSPSVL
jgi:pimeloyl-ACP methyl ester carboxylesterase